MRALNGVDIYYNMFDTYDFTIKSTIVCIVNLNRWNCQPILNFLPRFLLYVLTTLLSFNFEFFKAEFFQSSYGNLIKTFHFPTEIRSKRVKHLCAHDTKMVDPSFPSTFQFNTSAFFPIIQDGR